METSQLKIERVQPRLIRFKDIPLYIGMDRNRFNAEVRPHLTEIPIGKQGIAFDRYEVDLWIDDYKERHGRKQTPGAVKWDKKEHQDLGSEGEFGTLKSKSSVRKFTRALELATLKRQS